MTSEPDSTLRRRPPTIDLTATELKSEKPASDAGGNGGAGREDTQNEPGQPAGGNFANHWGAHAISAFAGAIVIAAAAFGLWFAGVLSPQTVTPPRTNDSGNAISAQLDKIEQELKPRSADTALASRLTDVQAQTKALSDSVAAINRRLDQIAAVAEGAREGSNSATAAAKTATDKADAAAAAAKGATQNSVQRSDLDALAAHIAALENSIQKLSAATTHQAFGAEDRAARAAVAAQALRAAVERGASYRAELATMKSFNMDKSAIAALEPFASAGVPTDTELAHGLQQLIASLKPAPVAAPSNTRGFLGQIEDNAKNLVRITSIDAPSNNERSPVTVRLDADARHIDIPAALSDIARLPQSAKALAEPWVQKATARNAALAASQRIAADALAALTSVKTQ